MYSLKRPYYVTLKVPDFVFGGNHVFFVLNVFIQDSDDVFKVT